MFVYKFVFAVRDGNVMMLCVLSIIFSMFAEGTPIFDIWIVHVEFANRSVRFRSSFFDLSVSIRLDVINFRENPLQF